MKVEQQQQQVSAFQPDFIPQDGLPPPTPPKALYSARMGCAKRETSRDPGWRIMAFYFSLSVGTLLLVVLPSLEQLALVSILL